MIANGTNGNSLVTRTAAAAVLVRRVFKPARTAACCAFPVLTAEVPTYRPEGEFSSGLFKGYCWCDPVEHGRLGIVIMTRMLSIHNSTKTIREESPVGCFLGKVRGAPGIPRGIHVHTVCAHMSSPRGVYTLTRFCMNLLPHPGSAPFLLPSLPSFWLTGGLYLQ